MLPKIRWQHSIEHEQPHLSIGLCRAFLVLPFLTGQILEIGQLLPHASSGVHLRLCLWLEVWNCNRLCRSASAVCHIPLVPPIVILLKKTRPSLTEKA